MNSEKFIRFPAIDISGERKPGGTLRVTVTLCTHDCEEEWSGDPIVLDIALTSKWFVGVAGWLSIPVTPNEESQGELDFTLALDSDLSEPFRVVALMSHKGRFCGMAETTY